MTGVSSRTLTNFVRHAYRSKRSGSVLESVYPLYLGLFALVFLGAPIYSSLENSPLSPGAARDVIDALPVALSGAFLAVLSAAVRFATWRGPVVFASPDISFLLTAPVKRADLVRPRLITGIGAFAGAGLLLGVLLSVMGEAKIPTPSGELIGACLFSSTAVLLLAGALAWLTERSLRFAEIALRVSTFAYLAAIALVVWSPGAGEGATRAVMWSGPWGWAAAPIAHAAGGVSPGWAPALILAAVASAATALSIARVDIPIEELDRRARLQSGISAALYVIDVRGMLLLQTKAKRSITGYARSRVPRPRARSLVIPWRDALALRRAPGRVVAAIAFIAAGSFAVATSGGGIFQVIAGVVLAYAGAARVVEPVRIEADDPEAASRLPSSWGDLMLYHALMPTGIIVVGLWIAAAALRATGAVSPSEAGAVIVASPALATWLALSAILAGARGRIPPWLFFYGGELILVWFITGPLIALGAVGLPVGIAVSGDKGGAEVQLGSAVFLLCVTLTALIVATKRRRPPN